MLHDKLLKVLYMYVYFLWFIIKYLDIHPPVEVFLGT